MNIISTRFEPPRHVRVNERGSAVQRFVYDPAAKKFVPKNEAAKRKTKETK